MPLRVGPLALSSEPSPPEGEQALLARVRAGDERAFEQIFTAHFASLCNFVRSYVRTPDEAEELVQELFLRLWQQRATWNPSSIRAYLFGATRNSAISYQRHARVVARFEDLVVRENLTAGIGCPPAQPDADMYAGELSAALREAVQALPERRRQVVVLRWENQLSQAEIAKVLGISIRTVETQFARAVASLRRHLASFRP